MRCEFGDKFGTERATIALSYLVPSTIVFRFFLTVPFGFLKDELWKVENDFIGYFGETTIVYSPFSGSEFSSNSDSVP